jgi:hypothetical protein
MSVIGERQVTGGNGRNISGQEGWIGSGYIKGFWISNKFRIRAVSIFLTQLASDNLPNFVKGARINFFGEGELW